MGSRNTLLAARPRKGTSIDLLNPIGPRGIVREADRWCADCDLDLTAFVCPACRGKTMHIAGKGEGNARKVSQGIADHELIVDLFAGGGGASLGITWATGRSPDIGINHNLGAIQMHADNHPQTRHFLESVWDVDPEAACGGLPVGLLHASPDCTHFSVAKGGTPVEKNIRGLANVVVRWAKYGCRIITLENVKEFLTWGPLRVMTDADNRAMRNEEGDFLYEPDPRRKGEYFRAWRKSIEKKGYTFGFKIMVAADYGTPTIRKRLFMCFRNDGLPIRMPKPTHGPGTKNPWRSAAECIDFRDQGHSIFLTKEEAKALKGPNGKSLGIKRPLADATLRRVARGILKHVLGGKAFIVNLTHGGRVEDISDPLNTITGANRGEKALISPVIMGIDHRGSNGDCVQSAESPVTTITKEARHAMVASTLVGVGSRAAQSEPRNPGEPMLTVKGKNDAALVAGVLVGQGGSEYAGKPTSVKGPLGTITKENHKGIAAVTLVTNTTGHGPTHPGDPAPTVATGGHQMAATCLLKAYTTTSDNADLREPAPTVTANDHNQLVQAVFIHQHNEGDRTKPVDEPIQTITGGGRSKRPAGNSHGLGLVAASLVQQQGKSVGANPENPLNTHTGVNHHQLATASLIRTGNGEREGQEPRCEDIQAPLTTVMSSGQKQALSLVKLRGTSKDGDTLDKPIGAIAAQGRHEALSVVQLITYYTSGSEYSVGSPAATITGTDRLALVSVNLEPDLEGAIRVARFLMEYCGPKDVVPVTWINVEGLDEKQPVVFLRQGSITALLGDILLRMLRDRELALCQGFGPDYLLTSNSTNNVARIGNSVCPQAAHAWVGAQIGTWEVLEEEPDLYAIVA
jgi:DNA (cytosine-5)-methyltransferase 1